VSRKSTDDLLRGLGIALAHEHLRRVGHEWHRRLLNPCCECCMYLRMLFAELEARENDARYADEKEETT
jgi:hypothetical protein